MEVLKLEVLREATKCSYCGFCEWVCPTLRGNRILGPRGRVTVASLMLREGLESKAGVDSVFSCLLCGACLTQCPAGVDIVKIVRLMRSYILLLH